MSGEKGMVDYRVESKQEAVRLVLEEHLSYAEVAVKLGLRKSERMEQVQTAYEASHRTYEYRRITLQAEMGHGGDLYSYSTRLGLSVHHQGLVRWLALSLGRSFHRTIPLSW